MPRDTPIRLTGLQLRRAVESAGGLWSQAQIASATDRSPVRLHQLAQRDDFPPTVALYGKKPVQLYAGEDLLSWMEHMNRYESAELFFEAVQRQTAAIRALSVREGRQAQERRDSG